MLRTFTSAYVNTWRDERTKNQTPIATRTNRNTYIHTYTGTHETCIHTVGTNDTLIKLYYSRPREKPGKLNGRERKKGKRREEMSIGKEGGNAVAAASATLVDRDLFY